jgi:hypothetical protein
MNDVVLLDRPSQQERNSAIDNRAAQSSFSRLQPQEGGRFHVRERLNLDPYRPGNLKCHKALISKPLIRHFRF